MNKTIMIMALLMATGCSIASPDAGTEVVLVAKPLIFGHGGVDPTPITTGTTYIALTTDQIPIVITPETYPLDLDDMMTGDKVPLDFHAIVRTKVTNTPTLVSKFGTGWFNNNVAPEFAKFTRDAVKRYGMNDVVGDPAIGSMIDEEITNALRAHVKGIELPVEIMAVTLGRANPPDAIKDQRVQTAQQEQRVITESKRKLAEDSRLEAERSRARADNAYRQDMQLNPQQFLELERIKMQHEACTVQGCTFIIGGSTPIVNLK